MQKGRLAVAGIIHCDHKAVNKRDVKQVIEQRHSSKDDKEFADRTPLTLKQAECRDRWTEGHQHKKNRRRILLTVNEGKDGEGKIALAGPGTRIAIAVGVTNGDEKQHEGHAQAEELPSPCARVEEEHRAKSVAGR